MGNLVAYPYEKMLTRSPEKVVYFPDEVDAFPEKVDEFEIFSVFTSYFSKLFVTLYVGSLIMGYK